MSVFYSFITTWQKDTRKKTATTTIKTTDELHPIILAKFCMCVAIHREFMF